MKDYEYDPETVDLLSDIDKVAIIMHHYGIEKQLPILCEECAELIQQACKCQRRGQIMHYDFIEELADVKIMIAKFELALTVADRRTLSEIIKRKLNRQLERMADEKHT